jgi:hypothetical protein
MQSTPRSKSHVSMLRMLPRGTARGVLFGISGLTLAALQAGCAVQTEDDAVEADSAELRGDPKLVLKSLRTTISTSQVQPTQIAFVGHPDYVAANLAFAPIAALRGQVETAMVGNLKNRGEAHVTTITPVEMGILAKKLSANQVERIAVDSGVQKAAIVPKCIGVGVKGTDATFYLVVESPDLLKVRRAIAAAFVAKGGSAVAFNAENFYPHATLGFTKRDLFEGDGVVKSIASCPNPSGLALTQ